MLVKIRCDPQNCNLDHKKEAILLILLDIYPCSKLKWIKLVCFNVYFFEGIIINKNCRVQIKPNFDIRTFAIFSCPWLVIVRVMREQRYHELLIKQTSRCSVVAKKRECSGFIQWFGCPSLWWWRDSTGCSTNSKLHVCTSVSNFYKWHVHVAHAKALLSCLSPLVHDICTSILNFDLVTCPVISFSVQTDVKGFWSLLTFILLLIPELYTVIPG